MILEEETKPTSFPRCISKALTAGSLSSLLPRTGAAAVPGWGWSREAVPHVAQTLVAKKGEKKSKMKRKQKKLEPSRGTAPARCLKEPLLCCSALIFLPVPPSLLAAQLLVKVGKGERE